MTALLTSNTFSVWLLVSISASGVMSLSAGTELISYSKVNTLRVAMVWLQRALAVESITPCPRSQEQNLSVVTLWLCFCREAIDDTDKLIPNKDKFLSEELESTVSSIQLWCVRLSCPQVTLLPPTGMTLEWKPCADLPVRIRDAQAVQLKTKVYVQGNAESERADYNIEISTDVWNFMKCPTKWAALTIYRSQLVLVGGEESTTKRVTNQLWVLQGEQTWTQPLTLNTSHQFRRMPGRCWGSTGQVTDLVEIYDGLYWVKANPLPLAWSDIKSTYHSGMWYMMGGNGNSTSVFYTSLQSLIEKATQQPPHSPNSSKQQPVWKILPDVLYERSSTTTLKGALLAVGGCDNKDKDTALIHLYSPLTYSWLHFCDIMPETLSATCSITLATGETMIIGGLAGKGWSSHVRKISLKLQQ